MAHCFVMEMPLAKLRVLDLTTEIAGAYATKLLRDAGAHVIKLEDGAAPDPLRAWSASHAPLARGEDGALFRFLAGGKQSVAVELASGAGRARILGLARAADVLVESRGPGGLDALGGVAALREANPRLSVVSLSPYGLTGPWARAPRPTTEMTMQAQCGATGYRGLPERGPVSAGGRIGEWMAGPYVALAALFTWQAARITGRGQHADVSQFESLLATLTTLHDLQGQFLQMPAAISIDTPSIEPTRDGWVGLTAYTGQQWKDFCLLIERPELGEDERLYEARVRMQHLREVQDAMHAWTKRHTVAEIIERANELRIPAAPIGDGKRVLELDHLRERGVFVRSPHGDFMQPRVPYRLSACAPRPFERAPKLGEHSVSARFEAHAPEAAPEWSRRATSNLPLSGLRVVDLTAFWAGPIVTSVFADLGADVIKVESIQRPDGMRFAGAIRKDPLWERGAVFHGVNCNKRGITLNLDAPEGRELLLRLVDRADVLIENFSVRVMEHFGLSWDALHARNPRLVLTRMPAWGLDGPWRDRVGFAPNVEQVSGLAWLTGYEDMPLVVRGACDPFGGMHAAFATLLALEQRSHTGEGQLVELPLVEPALNAAAEQVIEWTKHGVLLERQGNRGPYAVPQGVYRCAEETGRAPQEQFIAIAVASDAQWQALRHVLGDPRALRDAALASAAGRRAAHDVIDAAIGAWCAARTSRDAEAALLPAGVPASVCIDAHALLPNAQLDARAAYTTLAHPVTGATRYPELPMRFESWPRPLRVAPPPTLGQHNEELLRELGLREEEIAELRAKRVIGERPAWL
ncbi:MAG: CoA transferase [Deltaproteobacteria bacterium]|nr:CoA transferase [Deltaproteobacteria bacterium]